MNQASSIDVVVVNYNSGKALEVCINSLISSENSNLKVWVVDNHSVDDSLVFLENHSSKQVELISNNENIGFARACNQAASLGKSEIIAFVNPDCFVTESQLMHLSSWLSSSETLALMGCRVLNEDGSIQAATRRRLPTLWRVIFHLTKLCYLPLFKGINIKDNNYYARPIDVEAVNGACFLIKRHCFELIDGFDETYQLHFEDLDLFARLSEQGFHLQYDSSISVTHWHGHSAQDPAVIKNWKRQGLLRYFKKHRPRWESRLVSWLIGPK